MRRTLQQAHMSLKCKEAWSFYRTISGVRLCWELEEPQGPKGRRGHISPPTGPRLYVWSTVGAYEPTAGAYEPTRHLRVSPTVVPGGGGGGVSL